MTRDWHRLAVDCALAIRRHRGRFPEDLAGACATASVLLALVYRHHRIPCEFGSARLPDRGHVWVETAEAPVDLTATQLGVDALVHLARPAGVPWKRSSVARDFRMIRRCGSRVIHPSNPRLNYNVLVPSLAEVLGMRRTDARLELRARIGREVRS